MVNISKVVKMAESLRGTKAGFTLGKDALRKASGKAGAKGEAIFDFATKGLKNPAVDIAYKSSERGFTIAHATIRDGKKVIGNGAFSISGLGGEQSVIKYRLNMGENGNILQSSGWIDNAKQLTLDDIATSMTRKAGITTKTTRIGDAAASRVQFNENEFAQAADTLVGMPVASQALASGKNQVQGIIDKIQQGFRDLLAGKEVAVPKDSIGKLKDKFKTLKATKDAPKWKKAEKVSQEEIDKLMKQGVLDVKTGAFKKIKKDFIKVPSGKEVPIKEYQDAINSFVKAAKHVPDRQTEALLKEAKQLVEYADKQGVKLEKRNILEEIFKLYRL